MAPEQLQKEQYGQVAAYAKLLRAAYTKLLCTCCALSGTRLLLRRY